MYSGTLSGALFMGEEKPDEELMGKRKSSPRLSTASLDVDIYQDVRYFIGSFLRLQSKILLVLCQ